MKDFFDKFNFSQLKTIHSELIHLQASDIGEHSITINCNYPFNGTVLTIPKEHIINFEYRYDRSYSALYLVQRNWKNLTLDFKLILIEPAEISELEIDTIFDVDPA